MNRLSLNEEGQGLTEYLILLILVAVVSIGAVQSLGGAVKERLNKARDQIARIHVR